MSDNEELRRQFVLGTYKPPRGETRDAGVAADQDTEELRRQFVLGIYKPEDSEIRSKYSEVV